MANDYYDFNPSATTWAFLLTGVVVFVLILSLLLIVMVNRGQAAGPALARSEPADEVPGQRPQEVEVEVPASRAS